MAATGKRISSPLAEELGLEVPIFAFSKAPEVVAAVSRAGGMGVLGAVAYTVDQLREGLDFIEAHVDGKPYGVDVVMPAKYEGAGQTGPHISISDDCDFHGLSFLART